MVRVIAQLIACLVVLAAAAFLAEDPPRAHAAPAARYDLSNLNAATPP